MIISKRTINLLDEFTKVNPSILIRKNENLRTISNMKNVLAVADCEEKFLFDMPIYNLKEFVNVLKTFHCPEIIKSDRESIVIRELNNDLNSIRYKLAKEEMIVNVDKKRFESFNSLFDCKKVSVKIDAFTFARLNKVSKTIGARFFTIAMQKGKGVIKVGDETSFSYNFDAPKNIELITCFKTENIRKMTSGEYEIVITEKGISKFSCMMKKTPVQLDAFMNELPLMTDSSVEYLVANEPKDFIFKEIA